VLGFFLSFFVAELHRRQLLGHLVGSGGFLTLSLRVGGIFARIRFWLVLHGGAFAFDEINRVSIDNALVLTLNFKVVGNQVDWPARDQRMLGLLWSIPEAARVSAGRVAASTSGILLRFVSGIASLARVLLRASAHSLVHLLGRVLLLTAMGLALRAATTVVALRVVHIGLLLLTELLVLHLARLRALLHAWAHVGLVAAVVVRVLLVELILHDWLNGKLRL